MKSFLFPLAVLASSAVAQTTSVCLADYIVKACLSSEKAKLTSCVSTDYDCQCQQWKNIITCYNNCPDDPDQFTAGGQRDIFCGYASQFASTTAKVAAATQVPTETAAKATDNANAGQTGSGSAASKSGSTATSTGKAAANTNSAADLVLNAGSVLAAVAGVAAFIL